MKLITVPGSGSSSFSFSRGKVGLKESGYFRKILYNNNTHLLRTYGRLEESWNKQWFVNFIGSGKMKLMTYVTMITQLQS